MTTTRFVNGSTLSDGDGWANDVDTLVYSRLTSVSGTNTVVGTGPASMTAYAAGQRFNFIPANTNTGATTINITPSGSSALGAKNIFSGGASLRGGELVASIPVEVLYDGTQFNIIASGSIPTMVDPFVCNGRLTLTSGTPITTTDVTAAETVYFCPYRGNKIALYTGSTWKQYSFAEISVDVPDATQMNDVFIYDNSGTIALEVVAWTNDTTRATALTTQDGVYVKNGTTTKRYLGSFYSTTAGNGQVEDSLAKRNLWNYYNRVKRPMTVVEATSTWTYTTATFRQANASTANQLEFVVGVSEDAVTAGVTAACQNGSAGVSVAVGIGLDSTTVNSATRFARKEAASTWAADIQAEYKGFPSAGRHYLAWLEYSQATGTTTWTGSSGAVTTKSGIDGEILG